MRSAQRGAAALEHDDTLKGNDLTDAALEDDEASGAAQGRNLCINLLDDSEDEDVSPLQPVSPPHPPQKRDTCADCVRQLATFKSASPEIGMTLA